MLQYNVQVWAHGVVSNHLKARCISESEGCAANPPWPASEYPPGDKQLDAVNHSAGEQASNQLSSALDKDAVDATILKLTHDGLECEPAGVRARDRDGIRLKLTSLGGVVSMKDEGTSSRRQDASVCCTSKVGVEDDGKRITASLPPCVEARVIRAQRARPCFQRLARGA